MKRAITLSLILAMGALSACSSGHSTPGGVLGPTVSSIVVTSSASNLSVGQTSQLSVNATYNSGTTAALTSGLTCKSDNTAVATVNSDGIITAVGAGTAHITVTDTAQPSVTSVITVTVLPAVSSISLANSTLALAIGSSSQLIVTANYAGAPSHRSQPRRYPTRCRITFGR
jgi:hypothetical protein